MATWANNYDNSVTVTPEGDRPYGTYWTEIPDRPADDQVWDGTQWVPAETPVHEPTPIEALTNLLTAKGVITAQDAAAIGAQPAVKIP